MSGTILFIKDVCWGNISGAVLFCMHCTDGNYRSLTHLRQAVLSSVLCTDGIYRSLTHLRQAVSVYKVQKSFEDWSPDALNCHHPLRSLPHAAVQHTLEHRRACGEYDLVRVHCLVFHLKGHICTLPRFQESRQICPNAR